MKLESQVCSLELAMRLKELGVKQESLFVYCEIEFKWELRYLQNILSRMRRQELDDRSLSAFTVAELGEMLPDEFPGNSESIFDSFMVRMQGFQRWHVRYIHDEDREVYHCEEAETEADARAKMLIYLLENKLITI